MPELAGARVLVTGGAGFLGARLVRHFLRAGANVDLLLKPSTPRDRLAEVVRHVAIHDGDVADTHAVQAAFRVARPDFVFHLAMPHGHPTAPAAIAEALRTSVEGTANLLEGAAACGARRFVHAGSALEYAPSATPLHESDPVRPTTPRGVAKAAAARLAVAFARKKSLPVTVLRVFSVYGPGEPEGRLVATAIRSALEGTPMRLTAPGYRRDLVHVDDVCSAFLAAACRDAEPGATFNVGSGRQHANEEVVAAVERVTGRRVPRDAAPYPASPCDAPSRVADTTRAREALGFSARLGLEEGLAATIAEREARA